MYPFTARLFQKFHSHQKEFTTAIRCIAELDVLCSMSIVSSHCDYGTPPVRPDIVALPSLDAAPVLELSQCRHPIAEKEMGRSGGAGFVPNDTVTGTAGDGKPSVVLVTGPNMGGKSTVLRQTCLCVLMAQVGLWVHAESAKLSPVDRIFTRVGAQDSMIEGKSTFLVELEETSQILKHATRNSLAVIDELGRGTSTFDGAAIALAVLEYLTKRVRCRTMFATHYHLLATHQSAEVVPMHMAVDDSGEDLVFLYKLVPGLCPSSHGRNVAKMASLPSSVVEEAAVVSEKWRETHEEQGPELLVKEIIRLAKEGDFGELGKLWDNRKNWAGCL